MARAGIISFPTTILSPPGVEEYWALGLRNPFRFSFDPQGGTLWAAMWAVTTGKNQRHRRVAIINIPMSSGPSRRRTDKPTPARNMGQSISIITSP